MVMSRRPFLLYRFINVRKAKEMYKHKDGKTFNLIFVRQIFRQEGVYDV